MNLTIVYITSRQDSMFDLFLRTLRPQLRQGDEVKVICVESWRREPARFLENGIWVWYVPVMPNIWQGPSRITKHDWWAASTARNTGLCLTGTDWVAFCDDRSALGYHWLASVKEAQKGNYVVAGAYQKVANLALNNGRLTFDPLENGADTYRAPHGHPERAVRCGWNFVFGCTLALPTEWALEVNGFDETCNSVGAEDNMFGAMLHNNGRPIYYDSRMIIYEDRTPGKFQPSPPRRDKGVSPRDKSHALYSRLTNQKTAVHNRDIRAIRASVLNGGPWPIPTEPTNDFYDQEPLSSMGLS